MTQQINAIVEDDKLKADLGIDQPKQSDTQPNGAAMVANSPMTVPQSSPTQQSGTNQMSPVTFESPKVADDVDLIEKEWIIKIKELLTRNRGNPYQKANDLSALKKEYLQKRYNKAIE